MLTRYKIDSTTLISRRTPNRKRYIKRGSRRISEICIQTCISWYHIHYDVKNKICVSRLCFDCNWKYNLILCQYGRYFFPYQTNEEFRKIFITSRRIIEIIEHCVKHQSNKTILALQGWPALRRSLLSCVHYVDVRTAFAVSSDTVPPTPKTALWRRG